MATQATPAGAQAPPPGGFRRVWRTLKQLFHEIVGGLFAVMAFAWVQGAARAWTRDTAHWLIGVALGVAALMAFFSWTSFRRARTLR